MWKLLLLLAALVVTPVAAQQNPGTTGFDFSANKPALPNVGSNFGGSGVYANYVLIATVPSNRNRNFLDIENTSGAQIVVVLDDGAAAVGAQPTNASVFALAGAASPGAQGGSWSNAMFDGRVQVYSLSSTAQVAVFSE